MSATVLAARIALFEALCEDIREKAVRGSLKVSDVEALRDDLVAIGSRLDINPLARGLMNQALAQTDAVERYLNMDAPTAVSPMLRSTVHTLCHTLADLKTRLEKPKGQL